MSFTHELYWLGYPVFVEAVDLEVRLGTNDFPEFIFYFVSDFMVTSEERFSRS